MLTPQEARIFYNQFGAKQDSQAFYEDAPTTDLANHSHLEKARSIFEFGLGTGRFASKLLEEFLPNQCQYTGIDISPTMVRIARRRLDFWDDRVRILLSDGSAQLPEPDGSVDHFLSNYVLDLLDDQMIEAVIREAHRILVPEGWLCLVSLTFGKNWVSHGISSVWMALNKWKPNLVGGCRPIELEKFIAEDQWQIEYEITITKFEISSEVLVARRLS